MTELKPCPFCGSTDVFVTNKSVLAAVFFSVTCYECGGAGSQVMADREKAIFVWNDAPRKGDQ